MKELTFYLEHDFLSIRAGNKRGILLSEILNVIKKTLNNLEETSFSAFSF